MRKKLTLEKLDESLLQEFGTDDIDQALNSLLDEIDDLFQQLGIDDSQ